MCMYAHLTSVWKPYGTPSILPYSFPPQNTSYKFCYEAPMSKSSLVINCVNVELMSNISETVCCHE